MFCLERDGPLSHHAVRKMILRAGEAAGFPWPLHPHMLRHSCGYYLANEGTDARTLQHYLGHSNIQNTVRYTTLNAKRFIGLWE